MIVAITSDLILNASNDSLGRIIAWKDKDGLFNKIQVSSKSDEVLVTVFGTIEKLVEALPMTDWVLAGVKSDELKEAIQKSLG